MLVGLAVDGFATKGLSDTWATAQPSHKAAVLRIAWRSSKSKTLCFTRGQRYSSACLLLGVSALLPEEAS
jgi:hypothetical protein